MDTQATQYNDPAFDDENLAGTERMPNKVVMTRAPALGHASVIFIIVNRMIGTGIFRTPTTVAHGTHSVAYSLLFWAAGAVVAICGAHVFAEFGMAVPRLIIDNEKQAIPRNGGEKNYLEYLIKSPKFLATCLYGIPFIVLGTAAGNALVFAISIFRAADIAIPNDYAVRGLAIGVITFCCFMHGFWRRGGVILNNCFGAVKLVMLFVVFVMGVIYAAGGLGGSNEVAAANLSVHNSTKNPLHGAYGYAEAFLAVLFAYGGFNQATYVLGEIKDPRARFKPTTIWTVAGVGLLYCLVNLAYMMVVPAAEQFADKEDTVVAYFFLKIFGKANADEIQYSLMAFSSLGNILVQTFTAARVKQEIAKEGILPFSKFFADNKTLTPTFLRKRKERFSEATPVGAFCLHWVWSVVLILASIPGSQSADSYRIYVSLYSFVVDALFGFAIGLGILVLRFRPGAHWAAKSTSNKYISVVTALIFTVANFFPLVAVWFRPSGDSGLKLPVTWYATGTIGIGLIGVAFVWWVGLRYVVPMVTGRELTIDRESNFVVPWGYKVLYQEITSINWRTKSSSSSVEMKSQGRQDGEESEDSLL